MKWRKKGKMISEPSNRVMEPGILVHNPPFHRPFSQFQVKGAIIIPTSYLPRKKERERENHSRYCFSFWFSNLINCSPLPAKLIFLWESNSKKNKESLSFKNFNMKPIHQWFQQNIQEHAFLSLLNCKVCNACLNI